MKIIIFDVGNASCGLVVCPNGYGMMIDCGSNNEKECPIDVMKERQNFLNIKNFVKLNGTEHPLGLLHITHPDDDHVKNAENIAKNLKPYSLHRRKCEEFSDSDKINENYKNNLCNTYSSPAIEEVDWGFNETETFQIPMDIIKNDNEMSQKERNNSSILRYIKHDDIKILFCGDMEKSGWDWLCENDKNFKTTMSNGINILIAPHHGHKSGFPSSLFKITGNVDVVIHSKGSEANIDRTDVSSQYSEKTNGITYNNLNDEKTYKGKILTTRSNGNIYFDLEKDEIWTDNASPNQKSF